MAWRAEILALLQFCSGGSFERHGRDSGSIYLTRNLLNHSMAPSEIEQRDQNKRSFREVINLYIEMLHGSRFLFACAVALLGVSLLMYLTFAVAVGKLVDGAIENYIGPNLTDGWMASWGINQWALFLFGLVLINMVCSFFETCWFQVIGERAAADGDAQRDPSRRHGRRAVRRRSDRAAKGRGTRDGEVSKRANQQLFAIGIATRGAVLHQ